MEYVFATFDHYNIKIDVLCRMSWCVNTHFVPTNLMSRPYFVKSIAHTTPSTSSCSRDKVVTIDSMMSGDHPCIIGVAYGSLHTGNTAICVLPSIISVIVTMLSGGHTPVFCISEIPEAVSFHFVHIVLPLTRHHLYTIYIICQTLGLFSTTHGKIFRG